MLDNGEEKTYKNVRPIDGLILVAFCHINNLLTMEKNNQKITLDKYE